MKKLTFFAILFLFTATLFAQTAPADGSGTSADPYVIKTLSELKWISENPSSWDKHFSQRATISINSIGWDDGKGFTPIGNNTTPFTGSYTCYPYYAIQTIFINRPSVDYIGLFGKIQDAYIENVTLYCNVTGQEHVGGLVGYADGNSIISKCKVVGQVNTLGSGLSEKAIGGLVGTVAGNTLVKNCSSRALVNRTGTAYNQVGGLIGYFISGSVLNCYATGKVTPGASGWSGGLIGRMGSPTLPVTGCFWDKETSEINHSAAGIGKTTAEMKTMCTFFDGTEAAWDFKGSSRNGSDDIWGMSSQLDGYPFIYRSNLSHTATCATASEPVNTTTTTTTTNNTSTSTTTTNTTTTAKVSGSIKYTLDGRSYKTFKVVDGYIKKGKAGDVIYLANYNIAKGPMKTSVLLKVNLNAPFKIGTHTFAPRGKCKANLVLGKVDKLISKATGTIVFKSKSNGTIKLKSGVISINGSFSGLRIKK